MGGGRRRTIRGNTRRSCAPRARAPLARPAMSWKSAVVGEALESGTYRDKLGVFMEEARMLHLTEREAAQLYGEVMASLITLQRRIREWVEERQRVKDHGKSDTLAHTTITNQITLADNIPNSLKKTLQETVDGHFTAGATATNNGEVPAAPVATGGGTHGTSASVGPQ